MTQNKSFFSVAALAVLATSVALGQTQDTSGNGLLKGSFHFRHIAILSVDPISFDPTEIAATYGAITFDGAGHYSVSATTVDNFLGAQPLTVNGTYAIGSNGAGYVANPLSPNDFNTYMYGAVAQGIFTGSSTESQEENVVMNDLFVAIPAGPNPTNASFTTPYQTGLLDFAGAGPNAIKNALFELTPNGQGSLGAITLSGQAANQSNPSLTQSIAGATYNFNSDGSATLTIPLPAGVKATNALFTGSKTMFQSADGNFILGWSTSGYDIFVGVKTLTAAASNAVSAGLYFTAAVEDFPGLGADSYYGGLSNSGDGAGDGIVHERVNLPVFPAVLSYDYGTDDQIMLNPDGTAGQDLNGYVYAFGDGGQAFVAIGTDGFFSLLVGFHAPSFSGPGVYLNPIGVVNAASYQPITASLAPGELITLFGTGLASGTATQQGGQAFPTTLGGVSVTIDGIACPIYYVSPSQMAVIVPYEVASNTTGLANIQVSNNQVLSNVVQTYLTDAAPGSFSLNQNGLGLAAALHAATFAPITTSNPAQPGEYISLYMTGLGTVSPTVGDGALGPVPLSLADVYGAGNLSIYFNDYGPDGSVGNPGTIQFAGLAPGFAGLYQINVQVPTSGLASGDNVYVQFVTDAADVNQIQIPYGSSSTSLITASSRAKASLAKSARIAARRTHQGGAIVHRMRRGAPGTSPN